jgi:hypothetical protein
LEFNAWFGCPIQPSQLKERGKIISFCGGIINVYKALRYTPNGLGNPSDCFNKGYEAFSKLFLALFI